MRRTTATQHLPNVTDHRIRLTLYHLDRVLRADLGELVDAMLAYERTRRHRLRC